MLLSKMDDSFSPPRKDVHLPLGSHLVPVPGAEQRKATQQGGGKGRPPSGSLGASLLLGPSRESGAVGCSLAFSQMAHRAVPSLRQRRTLAPAPRK